MCSLGYHLSVSPELCISPFVRHGRHERLPSLGDCVVSFQFGLKEQEAKWHPVLQRARLKR
jgi:hypothetical protein